jgi:hypothetical protein
VQLGQLKMTRLAVRLTLLLGVAASVAANVLHALPNPISQAISAWPPLALLLTVELTSRIPIHKWQLAALRVLATIAIAGIAAWVSYWHMQGVAHRYGESASSSYLLPISVDGLIVVASVSLVELAGRIRAVEEARLAAKTNPPAAAPVTPVQFVEPAPAAPSAPVFQPPQVEAPRPMLPVPAPLAARTGEIELDRSALTDEAISQAPVSPAYAPGPRPYAAPVTHAAPVSPAITATTRPAPRYANGTPPPARPNVSRPAVSTTRTVVTSATTKPAESTTPRPRRPVHETARLADEIEAMEPQISETDLAKRLGITAERLRTIRRDSAKVGSAE